MDEAALLGLGSEADPQAQQRAVQYFEQLKASDNGWELCANAISSGVYSSNDHAKFFCLQVIEFHLKQRYKNAGTEEQQKIKAFLLGWLQMHCQNPSKDRTFICNKAAQIFTLAFVADYPVRWPSFFVDLLSAASQQVEAVWIYLRVLMAIDTEVVDREITHTDPEYQRNTLLKDAMREHSVVQMVDSWYHIVTSYDASHPELTCYCLGVIGAYVAWIDINLIANERFVSVLLKFMTMPLLRESTCDCIHEIISKGMEPKAKTELIESFTTVLTNTGVFNITEDEGDWDYLAKLSKLINGIGIQLIQCWQRLIKAKEDESAKVPLAALESKVSLMLKFLGHEDDDVSGGVTQFAHDYITTLKQLTPLSDHRKVLVKDMLFVIVKKMKFDSYNFEHEGEDEAMFQEYRKELKVIFNNLGALDSELLLCSVQELCTQTFSSWQSAKFDDVEIAVTLLYQLAEALPASHGQHFSGEPGKASVVQQLMRLMVTSKVSCYQHCAVQLQFFETVVRYEKFFSIEPEHLAEVLVAFLDERGLRNGSSHVRSRTAYLFSRFVKSINKQHLSAFLEDILSRITDLLVLNSPDNGSVKAHYLSSDDQLFMYETAGILIVHSHLPPEKKQVLMKQLLAPIVGKFEGLLANLMNEPDEQRQLLYAQCLSHAMAFASRSSKGFTASATMKQCGCVEAFTETLQLFLLALRSPRHRLLLHTGVRQFLHRMVVCLDAQVLPFIPVAMETLTKDAEAKELHDFIPLLNQVVGKFKKQLVPFLQSQFVPLVTAIFSALSAPLDERDQTALAERRLLQRSYFSFLAALVNNDVAEVLSQQESSSLHQVLLTLIQGAVDLPDPTAQKAAYGILRKLVDLWAGANGLNGFTDFVYESIVPACFLGPLKPSFDLNDAQTTLAMAECAMCLKAVHNKRGEEAATFLAGTYLPTLQLSPALCQEFCQALKAEPKVFKSYFKSFFLRAKS